MIEQRTAQLTKEPPYRLLLPALKLLDLRRRFPEPEAERDDAARRGAGDGVEVVGNRLSARDLFLDQRQNSCRVDAPDAAAVK